jgi:hypothetical protein
MGNDTKNTLELMTNLNREGKSDFEYGWIQFDWTTEWPKEFVVAVLKEEGYEDYAQKIEKEGLSALDQNELQKVIEFFNSFADDTPMNGPLICKGIVNAEEQTEKVLKEIIRTDEIDTEPDILIVYGFPIRIPIPLVEYLVSEHFDKHLKNDTLTEKEKEKLNEWLRVIATASYINGPIELLKIVR